jgi:integrase
VLNLYLADKASKHARPEETRQRVLTLADFWQPFTLSDVDGQRCREYVKLRVGKPWKSARPEKTGNPPRLVTEAAARRELEDLRAAINYHRMEGLCSEIISIPLPEKSPPRVDWLTRSEAAKLIWAAWRAKQVMHDRRTKRDVGKHIARFLLTGCYTGSRSGAICGAALMPTVGRGYVDLEHGVFYRQALGVRATKKRQPPVRLPDRLLAHLRRWGRLGIAKSTVVEWNGKPVRSVRKGFETAVRAAGLERWVTPHILRHTAATWAMQAGADPWQTAGFLGMSVELLLAVYGHHHPDYQREAAAAIARSPGPKWDRNPVNKTRQTASNVTKIADISKGAR